LDSIGKNTVSEITTKKYKGKIRKALRTKKFFWENE
jgi:hypothetical protein